MQQKNIILSISVLLIFMSAYSQDDTQNEYREWESSEEEYVNFDIGKYFTPDIVRNQMSIYFDLNSDYSHANSDNQFYEYRGVADNYDFTGHIVYSFSRNVNTRGKISNFGVNLSLNEDYTSRKSHQTFRYSDLNNDVVGSDLTSNLGTGWRNKWYFSKLFFLNYNVDGNISYNFKREEIKNYTAGGPAKQNEFSLRFSPQTGAGYGRIENVEDARQAVYIANALSKRNILTRNLSNEELFELSQKISTVKNKRFLDSRQHLIAEISTVDSFFVKKKLLNDIGATYFTTLYDMWQYGALFSRQAGYEISFVISPYYTYDYLKNTPELQDGAIHYPHQARLETNLTFNYEKPFKLNWQHSISAGGFAVFNQGKAGKTDFNSIFSNRSKTLIAGAYYSLNYYPNTRTNIRATVGSQAQVTQYISKHITEDYTMIDTYCTAMSGISINYYFAPHFRVTSYCDLNYGQSWYKTDGEKRSNANHFSTAFNVQLVYFIF